MVVTDGESHDGEELPAALKACEAGRVTCYGIAVRLDSASGRPEGLGDDDIGDRELENHGTDLFPDFSRICLPSLWWPVFCASSDVSLCTANGPHLGLLTPGPRSLHPAAARPQLVPAGDQSYRQ